MFRKPIRLFLTTFLRFKILYFKLNLNVRFELPGPHTDSKNPRKIGVAIFCQYGPIETGFVEIGRRLQNITFQGLIYGIYI